MEQITAPHGAIDIIHDGPFKRSHTGLTHDDKLYQIMYDTNYPNDVIVLLQLNPLQLPTNSMRIEPGSDTPLTQRLIHALDTEKRFIDKPEGGFYALDVVRYVPKPISE